MVLNICKFKSSWMDLYFTTFTKGKSYFSQSFVIITKTMLNLYSYLFLSPILKPDSFVNLPKNINNRTEPQTQRKHS